MIVEQVWTGNAYRNFNYLVVCRETGDALAVDPLDYPKCLAAADKNGWTITLTDLAGNPKYAEKQAEMEALLLSEMKRHDDPYRLWDQPRDDASKAKQEQ